MNFRRLRFALSLVALVACGGQVKSGTSTGGGNGSTSDGNDSETGGSKGSGGGGSDNTPGGSGSASAGPSVAVGATSILLTKGVLGEYAPGGGCGSSFESIAYDLTTNSITVMTCVAHVVDAGPDTPNSLVTRTQRTLTAAEIDRVQNTLAEYAEIAPPPKSECGYDGTAYELDVTTKAATTRYWDQSYNCAYPSDVKFVSPWLPDLFSVLDAM